MAEQENVNAKSFINYLIYFKPNLLLIPIIVILLFSSSFANNCIQDSTNLFLSFSKLPQMPDPVGMAGPFAGISGSSSEVLIIAGGANFPKPFWETDKKYYNNIWVLEKESSGSFKWHTGFNLDKPLAYGSSVTTGNGIVCMGGRDTEKVFRDVFIIRWDTKTKKIKQEYLPGLPFPCAHGDAAVIGDKIYLAGGQSGTGMESAMNNFWMLDLSQKPDYFSMNQAELAELAEKRGIALTDNEIKSLRNSSYAGSADYKDEVIKKLVSSDRDASGFYYMELEKLMAEAKKRNLNIKENYSREKVLQDLSESHWGGFKWEKLPSWPGKERAFNITSAQHNGYNDCVYVISGRKHKEYRTGETKYEFMKDVYEFNPVKYDHSMFDPEAKQYSGTGRYESPWRRRSDAPQCVMAGPGIEYGQSHIFILGGDNGSIMHKASELKDSHPGFPKIMFAYHTITDTWINAGPIPANHVTTTAVKWDGSIIIPSGEIRPRTRTPDILKADPLQKDNSFGLLNFSTLFIYLLSMVGIGIYFARKNKNTDDYFRGGQKIPWWAAGCSIFATMLSSLTYMAVPSKAFAANWEYILGYPIIMLMSVFVAIMILPFFRNIDATSAYEYLEKRFNRYVRMIGSALFIMFQIGRMAIVMFLSALALAAITPFSPSESILIMGVLSIIYCTLGGVEAVIWTDTIQTFVLLGGAFLILGIILFQIDGGPAGFFSIASAENKFKMVNWDWDMMSFTTAAFWVLIIGAVGQNLVSYTSDQAVVQRYMTTTSRKQAARAILTNGFMAIPAGLLFFSLGAALFVFYKSNPASLDPAFNTDAVMPMFIVKEVPAGLAGLIVAGIFAAAQSTISTSMNSTSTALITDFFRPFRLFQSEKAYLNSARIMTVIFGVAGTAFALLFASADIKSLLDEFFAVIGLFGGSLGGLFLLGMFTKRANGPGAVFGAAAGALALYLVKTYTGTHFYLYAFIGIAVCFFTGYFISLIFPADSKSIDGLTVYTINKNIN